MPIDECRKQRREGNNNGIYSNKNLRVLCQKIIDALDLKSVIVQLLKTLDTKISFFKGSMMTVEI